MNYLSLTKENFWNSMNEKYPEEMKQFCDWIDEYKKRIKWNIIFADDSTSPNGLTVTAPKYHELPIAMQIGIFMQFVIELKDHKPMMSFNDESMEAWGEEIHCWFLSYNGYNSLKPCKQCESCKHEPECRFKAENIKNSCKFYITTKSETNGLATEN